MKQCDEQKIWELIDGELCESECEAIQKHFKVCPKCLKEYKENVSLDKEIGKLDCLEAAFKMDCKSRNIIEYEVSKQYRPLLTCFRKRLLCGLCSVSFISLAAWFFLFPFLFPGSTGVRGSNLLEMLSHPATITFFGLSLAFFLLYLTDKLMQKWFDLDPNA